MAERQAPIGTSFGAAAVLHVAFVVLIVLFARASDRIPAPVYRVNIIAAAPGERQIGVVQPTPPTPEPLKPTDPPPLTQRDPVLPTFATKKVPPPTRVPPRATPTTAPPPTKKPPPAPAAAGGPTGGTGTDVANVHLEGVDFPYPEYLNNIVRQIALNFKPDDPNTALRAVIFFLIRRDGKVTGVSFRTRSGDYAFDLEAQGAIEKAATQFGALPQDFHDDVLPVYFSFDPRLIH